MNFKGHVTGGIISSAVVATTSFLLMPTTLPIASPLVLLCFCFCMSLFPDLDVASKPQQYYYRSLVIILPILYYKGEGDLAVIVSYFSFLPLIHHHRGYTHWKITPWVMSIIFLIFLDRFYPLEGYSPNVIWSSAAFITLAIVTGHYTHLFLDSKFFRNNSNHH